MESSDLRVIISVVAERAKEDLKAIGSKARDIAGSFMAAQEGASIAIDDIEQKVEKLKTDMADMRGSGVEMRVDTEPAKAALAALRADADTLKELTMHIDVKDTKAKEQLDALQERLFELGADADKLKISVNDTEAMAKLDEVQLKLDELHDKYLYVRVKESYEGGPPGTKKTATSAPGPGLAGYLMLGLPLVTPLAVAGTGAIMGLGSAFTAAAGGAAAFAAVAVPNLKSIVSAASAANKAQAALATAQTKSQRTSALHQLALAYYGLDHAQRNAVTSLQSFQSFYKGFVASFNKPVLHVFTKGLDILHNLLVQAKPVITAAADAISKLVDAMDKSVKSGALKSTFQWMASQAGPAITTFAETAGNFLKGFISIMEAFTPAAHRMENGMVHMSAGFAKWAASLKTSRSFEQFMKAFKKDGPLVGKLIADLASVIGKLVMAMQPIGAVMLPVIDDLLKFTSALMQAHPKLVTLAVAVFEGITMFKILKTVGTGVGEMLRKVAMLFGLTAAREGEMSLKTIVLTAAQKAREVATNAVTVAEAALNLVMRANPIGLVITALALLVAGIVLLIKNWKAVKSETEKVWKTLSGWLTKTWDDIKKTATKTWDELKKTVGGTWTDLKKSIEKVGGDLETAVQGVWKNIKSTVTGAIASISTAIHNFIQDVENAIHAVESLFSSGPSHASAPSIGRPRVPRLASGGVVNSPTLALVGEAGPEAVLPLSRYPIHPGAISSLAGTGRSAPTIIVNVTGNITESEEKLGDIVAAQMMRRVKMRGLVG